MSAPYIEEDCVVEFEGQTFEAGGAVVTPDEIVAYPGDDGRLNDWHGNELGTWRQVASWTHPTAFGCPTIYQIEATVDGTVYTGRGFGKGMIYRGKRKRS